MTTQRRRLQSRRGYTLSVLAGILSGGAGFFAASRAWSSVTVRTAGLPTDRVTVDGSRALPIVGAMALVIMAGSVAVLATSHRVRVLVGSIIAAAGMVSVAFIVTGAGTLRDALVQQIASSPAMAGDEAAQLRVADQADGSLWRWVALLASMLGVAVGAAVVAYGWRWPVMGRKYEAPGAAKDAPASPRDGEPSDSDLWKALDRGDDPTV